MGTYSSAAQRSTVGMREAGEESNKVKIINLFHASKSQQNRAEDRERKRGGRKRGRLCLSERWVQPGNGLIMLKRAVMMCCGCIIMWLPGAGCASGLDYPGLGRGGGSGKGNEYVEQPQIELWLAYSCFFVLSLDLEDHKIICDYSACTLVI